MIRKTDPPDILPRRFHDDFDLPPCVLDEGHDGELNEPDDPLSDDRHGIPKSRKHLMHDRECEKEDS